jgi:hypothetical protein
VLLFLLIRVPATLTSLLRRPPKGRANMRRVRIHPASGLPTMKNQMQRLCGPRNNLTPFKYPLNSRKGVPMSSMYTSTEHKNIHLFRSKSGLKHNSTCYTRARDLISKKAILLCLIIRMCSTNRSIGFVSEYRWEDGYMTTLSGSSITLQLVRSSPFITPKVRSY